MKGDPLPVQAGLPDAEPSFPSAAKAWGSVAALLFLYGLAYFDRQIIALMVGDLRHDLQLSDLQIGLLQGLAFALCYSVLGLACGYAADRYRRRAVIAVGVIVWASATLASGFAQNFPQIFVARMMVGAGEAALLPAAFSMISDLFPRRRLTLAMSVFSVGGLIGIQVSLVLSGLLLKWADGGVVVPFLGLLPAWRFAFIAAALPAFTGILLLLVIPEPIRRLSPGDGASTWADVGRFMLRRRRFFLCHFVGFGSLLCLSSARLEWAPALLQRRFGWPVDQVGVTLGAFGIVAGSGAMLISGWIVEGWANRGAKDAHFRFYIIASFIVVAAAFAFLSPKPFFLFVGLAAVAIPFGQGAIAAASLRAITPPDLRGRVFAVYLLVVGFAGMSIGPGLVGWITEAVFHDPDKLHLSLMAAFLGLGPIALVAFLAGLKPMRDGVTELERLGDI